MKLKTVDSLKYVKENPDIFFANTLETYDLATGILRDVISLGCAPCQVDICLNWWIVASKKNWLQQNIDYSLPELFTHMIPNPSVGLFAIRGEILLNAFAENIIVSENGEIHLIKGQADPQVIEYIKNYYSDFYTLTFGPQIEEQYRYKSPAASVYD